MRQPFTFYFDFFYIPTSTTHVIKAAVAGTKIFWIFKTFFFFCVFFSVESNGTLCLGLRPRLRSEKCSFQVLSGKKHCKFREILRTIFKMVEKKIFATYLPHGFCVFFPVKSNGTLYLVLRPHLRRENCSFSSLNGKKHCKFREILRTIFKMVEKIIFATYLPHGFCVFFPVESNGTLYSGLRPSLRW